MSNYTMNEISSSDRRYIVYSVATLDSDVQPDDDGHYRGRNM